MEVVFDESKFRVLTKDNLVERIKVEDYLYILDEVNSARMYLIVGKEKALLFDTGYGLTDFRPLIEEVTKLPLYVVCSHGHDDHIYGNDLFDTVYMGEPDYALAMSYDNPVSKDKLIRSRYGKTPNIEEIIDRETYMSRSIKNCEYKFVHQGDVFDLGGLTLSVQELPGHTKGSIGLFCEQTGDFFTGDVLMYHHNFMYGHGIEWSDTPDRYIHGLTSAAKLDIKKIWPAHGTVPAPRELIDQAIEMFKAWAENANPEEDLEKVGSVFGRACLYHYKDMVLAYKPQHLDEMRQFMKEHNGAIE